MARRLVRLLAGAAFAATLLAGAGSGRAYACDCMPTDAAALFAQADSVFVGTVTAVAIPPSLPGKDPSLDPISISFTVESVLKGAEMSTAQITTAGNSAACGVAFSVGQRWQINALLDRAVGLATNSCSGDALLGAGEVPAPTESGGPPTQILLAGGVILAVAAFSAWAFTRRPREDRSGRSPS